MPKLNEYLLKKLEKSSSISINYSLERYGEFNIQIIDNDALLVEIKDMIEIFKSFKGEKILKIGTISDFKENLIGSSSSDSESSEYSLSLSSLSSERQRILVEKNIIDIIKAISDNEKLKIEKLFITPIKKTDFENGKIINAIKSLILNKKIANIHIFPGKEYEDSQMSLPLTKEIIENNIELKNLKTLEISSCQLNSSQAFNLLSLILNYNKDGRRRSSPQYLNLFSNKIFEGPKSEEVISKFQEIIKKNILSVLNIDNNKINDDQLLKLSRSFSNDTKSLMSFKFEESDINCKTMKKLSSNADKTQGLIILNDKKTLKYFILAAEVILNALSPNGHKKPALKYLHNEFTQNKSNEKSLEKFISEIVEFVNYSYKNENTKWQLKIQEPKEFISKINNSTINKKTFVESFFEESNSNSERVKT